MGPNRAIWGRGEGDFGQIKARRSDLRHSGGDLGARGWGGERFGIPIGQFGARWGNLGHRDYNMGPITGNWGGLGM